MCDTSNEKRRGMKKYNQKLKTFYGKETIIWVKFELNDHRQVRDNMIIILSFPFYDSAEIYTLDKEHNVICHEKSGLNTPTEEKSFSGNKTGFKFLPVDKQSVFIKLSSHHYFAFEIKLFSELSY